MTLLICSRAMTGIQGWVAMMLLMVAMITILLMVAKALTTSMAVPATTAFLAAQGMIFWKAIGGRIPIAGALGLIFFI
jgi:hypothetical protein